MWIIIKMLLLISVFETGADDFLSKFYQQGYILKNYRAEVVRINEKLVKVFELKTFKYNRTTIAFNATLCTKIDTEDKIEMVVQAYKRASNEYRRFPIRFQVNYCKIFSQNIAGLLNLHKCGNHTTCLWKKDVVYHTCNFYIDDNVLPPLIPAGEYKIEGKVLYMDQEFCFGIAYGEVDYPIRHP